MTKDLAKICADIYRQMYAEATPYADYDTMLVTGEASHPGFFMAYYLPQDRQDAIITEHCKAHRLSKRESGVVRAEVCLGCSPRGTQ